jgi:uncharacterized protein
MEKGSSRNLYSFRSEMNDHKEMTIGLLSDTHSYLDDKILSYFENCDEIWHAGDIGDAALLQKLKTFKPVRAVYGNIDDLSLQKSLPEDLWFEINGLTFLMTHIAGSPPRYNPRVKRLLKDRIPDVLICGHSHILRIKRDESFNNMLFINPGAAGNHGFHTIKTIVRFRIGKNQIENMEVIELGKRGALPE